MNSELINILVSSALSGLFVGLVVWAVAMGWSNRVIDAARTEGGEEAISCYLLSQAFLDRLREARLMGMAELAVKTDEKEARHASDLVAARAAGFKDGKSMNDMEAYEAGYRDGEKQGYREGHEAADEANAIAVTGMVDALGGVSMDAIDNTLKAMNFPECLGVEPIKLTAEMKEAMDNPEATVVIDATGAKPVVRIEPNQKDVKPNTKSKSKSVKPKPTPTPAKSKEPRELRRKPAKPPVEAPKEVKAPRFPKKAPVAPVDPPCCDPCEPCKPKRRSR